MNKLTLFFLVAFMGTGAVHGQVYNWADGEEPFSPDSIGGLYFGLNLGFYKANNSSAAIYGGYGFDRAGAKLDFANSWLNQAIQGNVIARNRTNEAMQATDGEWIFAESDMPGTMRYSPSFMVGFHLRYMFNADFGMFAEINGTQPVTVGEFTIQRTAPSPIPNQSERLERFQIRGEEQRLVTNLGLHRVLGRKAKARSGGSGTLLPYVEMGLNMTFVKFEENFINLGDRVPNVDLTIFYTQQGFQIDQARILTGVGFGGFAGAGGQLQLGSKFTLNLGYIASLEHIKLGDINERNFQHIFVLRAIYLTF